MWKDRLLAVPDFSIHHVMQWALRGTRRLMVTLCRLLLLLLPPLPQELLAKIVGHRITNEEESK